jgi:RNA polymerase sigma factor (sigma-70 family)
MDVVSPVPNFMSAERKSRVAEIVRDVGQRLSRFIRARVASDADAADVLQDVWQQLIASLDEGPIEQVGGWLYAVARNRIIDRYRKPRMASLDAMENGGIDDEAPFNLAGLLLRDENTPVTEHLRQFFWDQFQAALAELPEEQRQVFVWHELEEMSFQEIAALTART